MNIRFSNSELELMYKILSKVKSKYNTSLDSNYSWINMETLNGLITRFKFNLNDAFIQEIEKELGDVKFLKEIYKRSSIWEFSTNSYPVYYKIVNSNGEFLDVYFDTVDEAKKYIDSKLNHKS